MLWDTRAPLTKSRFSSIALRTMRGAASSFVGRIAVHQHKDVGVNVGEHPTHDVSLSLTRLVTNNRARSLSDVNGAIGRIVVVNVDCRQREGLAKGRDRLPNRQFFIEARHEDYDLVLTHGRLNPGLQTVYARGHSLERSSAETKRSDFTSGDHRPTERN